MCDFWMYSVNLGVLIRQGDNGLVQETTAALQTCYVIVILGSLLNF